MIEFKPSPLRRWADEDLRRLCNFAVYAQPDDAQGLHGIGTHKVQRVIARYVPDGSDIHSRFIPEDQREIFARELERTFKFTYRGA